MARRAKAEVGKPCPRCGSTITRQHTNFGAPMKGRFTCFGCKRTWDETPGHEAYGDHISHIQKGAR
jgi:transposase-like protein